MTKPTLVITPVRMLHFTRHCKDTLQRRLIIWMSFCSKFITVYVYQIIIRIRKDLTKLLQK